MMKQLIVSVAIVGLSILVAYSIQNWFVRVAAIAICAVVLGVSYVLIWG